MYKVYLKIYNKTGHSEVQPDTRTTTQSAAAAVAAFRELIARRDLVGRRAHAVLSLNNRQLAYHRFDRSTGDCDVIGPGDEIRLAHDD